MKMFQQMKEGWEDIWLPRIQEGKTKIELERDKRYESRWVWYHTILAFEIFLTNILLIAILLAILLKG